MPTTLPEQIRIAPYQREVPVLTHPSGFHYTRTSTSTVKGYLANADVGWLIPNHTVDKVFLLEVHTTDYEFYKWDTALVLVIPAHDDPNTVMGFTAKMELNILTEAVLNGNIGEHGEILNQDLVFLAPSPHKVYLEKADSEAANRAMEYKALQERPHIRNKDLIPGHWYTDKRGNNLVFFGRVRSPAGRLQYVFYSAGSWRNDPADLRRIIETSHEISHWNQKRSASPKCVENRGRIVDMTEEIRNKCAATQHWDHETRRYNNTPYEWVDELPSPHNSEARDPSVMTSEVEGSNPSAGANH